MVKKLCKYEFFSYIKTMLPMYIVLIGIALINRFIQIFEAEKQSYKIFFISSVVFLVIAMITCIIMTYVLSVTRFYKNMFTNEGYLTMTLPVTPFEHIVSKLLISMVFVAFSIVAVIVAGVVALSGEALIEVWKAAMYFVKETYKVFGFETVIYALEGIIALVLALAASILLFYACCSVGQLAKKNRIWLAVGVYFGYYAVCQLIGTVFIILGFLFDEMGIMADIENFIIEHLKLSIHIGALTVIVISAALGAVYMLVSHAIIRKKLNIE
ncbi:MAG: hypothetical protein KBS59_06705 [Clostridiales bacterium]|nr:hypothetical protein [Clostridiales bacterium]